MPTLSVAIPAYNEEATIGGCLESLLGQTRPVDEIVVVDNGSTDRTSDVVASYASRHGNIRIVSESEPGIIAARGRGFDEATGDIIAKTDADSRPDPDWAEKIMDFFDSDAGREYAALAGLAVIWDGPAPDFQRRYLVRSFRKHPDGLECPGGLNGPNYAVRTEAWKQVRDAITDDPAVWEDLDLGLALAEAGLRKYLDPRIMVATSGRQLRHSPWANRQYLLGGIRTAKARGDKKITRIMRLDLPVRFVNFTVMWLFFRPWDPAKRNWRPHRLLTGLERDTQLVTGAR